MISCAFIGHVVGCLANGVPQIRIARRQQRQPDDRGVEVVRGVTSPARPGSVLLLQRQQPVNVLLDNPIRLAAVGRIPLCKRANARKRYLNIRQQPLRRFRQSLIKVAAHAIDRYVNDAMARAHRRGAESRRAIGNQVGNLGYRMRIDGVGANRPAGEHLFAFRGGPDT